MRMKNNSHADENKFSCGRKIILVVWEKILLRTGKIPIGEEEILLADKKIYLAVEFARLAEADSYVLTQAAEAVPGRRLPL